MSSSGTAGSLQWAYEEMGRLQRHCGLEQSQGAALVAQRAGFGKTFGALVDALEKLPVKSAVLDGEIVMLDGEGKPSFQALQYFSAKDEPRLVFYSFDLIALDGEDLRLHS